MKTKSNKAFKTQLRIYISLIFLILSLGAIIMLFSGFKIFSICFQAAVTIGYLIFFFKIIPDFWNNYTYTHKNKAIKIERGIIYKSTVCISQSSVQYICVTSGIIQRLLGICTVNFVMGAGFARLFGISPKLADEIRLCFERNE